MSLPVQLRRAASAEWGDAADWYEARQIGRGRRFTDAVQLVLDEIGRHPLRWPDVWNGVREVPVRKWPYCVYYEVHPDHVLVLSVFHTSRDPAVWQGRA